MKHIDHVGVAVSDLDAAMAVWNGLLGQTPALEEVETQSVKTATYPCGIELIAPTGDSGPISKFLATRGGGIHHVTIRVKDIDVHLRRLKDAGVRLINEEATPGAGGCRVAFIHPAATGGVLLELAEHVE